MPGRALHAIVLVAVAGAAAAGGLVLGQVRADDGAAPDASARAGGYVAGIEAGRSEGIAEGRALQEGLALPPGSRRAVRAAFSAGYEAGANDAFGAFDGGWSFGVPYVITLARGSGAIAYRIAGHVELARGVDYFLCPSTRRLCRKPHG